MSLFIYSLFEVLVEVLKFINKDLKKNDTLKREPIEENLEDFDVSSGSGGKRPDTKEHLDTCRFRRVNLNKQRYRILAAANAMRLVVPPQHNEQL